MLPVRAPATEDVLLTGRQEHILLLDRQQRGIGSLSEAESELQNARYEEARALFSEADVLVPDRPGNEEMRRRILRGHAESSYRLAEEAFDRGDVDGARRYAQDALADEARQGARVRALTRRIDRREARIDEIEARPIPVEQRADLVERRETIEQFFDSGRRYFEAGELDLAEKSFEQILLENPYHRDAMRFLRRIEDRRMERTNLRRETTVSDMMHDVRRRWHPPIRQVGMAPDRPTDRDVLDTRAQRLQQRMTEIVIPSIEFRQANIVDVIDFLREASVPTDPEGIGVNIILQLDLGPAPAAPGPRRPSGTDPWGDIDADLMLPQDTMPAPASGSGDVPAITLSLRRVSLLDAIRYVTDVANLRYRIEDNAVIITPAGQVTGRVITRMYPVQPSILDIVVERQEQERTDFGGRSGEFIGMGSGQMDMRRGDVKPFFESMGVPFPQGTNITYNASISQLIVSNTAENIELFERILAQLNVIPSQVEIEARFMEIAQTDLEELGFEWMLTDSMNIAARPGSDPITMRERIQVDRNVASGGFTAGLRYFSIGETPQTRLEAGGMAVPMAGDTLRVSSVLTNPELSFVLHALRRRGRSDLLSAPRVTTRSGVNAQIQAVLEIIYPSEYMEQSLPSVDEEREPVPGDPVTDSAFRVPYPSAFETREVGVILNVTPTVGPDGYTIDLTLVPEVSELIEWIDYGPPDRFPILQPIFSSRNATTSIVIWDGQTVVMGGVVRDQVSRFQDRIPVLGDLPLIGRFFRSEGQRSAKQNLVLFVTARMVDPAGNPIHSSNDAMAVSVVR